MPLRRFLAAPVAALTLFSQTPPQAPLVRVATRLAEVSVVVRDKSGLSPAVFERGVTVTRVVDLKPGMWEIRVAAINPGSGKTGSLFVPAHQPLSAGPPL